MLAGCTGYIVVFSAYSSQERHHRKGVVTFMAVKEILDIGYVSPSHAARYAQSLLRLRLFDLLESRVDVLDLLVGRGVGRELRRRNHKSTRKTC